MVKKFYMETKDSTLESAILDVWKNAAENNMSGEDSFEVGTDRYAEYTAKITPGQTEEGVIGNIAKAGAKAVGSKIKSTAKSAYGKTIVGKAQSAVAKKVKKVGSAIKRVKQAAKTGEEYDPTVTEELDLDEKVNVYRVTSNQKQGNIHAKNEKEAEKIARSKGMKGKLKITDKGEYKGQPSFEASSGQEQLKGLKETVLDLWKEAADTHVDPKDREELDKAPEDTAKKMKRATEPKPMVATEEVELDEGSKEEYEKFFKSALKKFKIDSPADLKSDEEKKKFFNYIDKNYTGEKDEEFGAFIKEKKKESAAKLDEELTIPQVQGFKVSSMKHALAKVWGLDEGELPPALKKAIAAKKKDGDEDEDKKESHIVKKGGKTETGKKMAEVEIDPELKEKNKK